MQVVNPFAAVISTALWITRCKTSVGNGYTPMFPTVMNGAHKICAQSANQL